MSADVKRDLARMGDLLSLHGRGVLAVDHAVETSWLRACRAVRLLPPLAPACWEGEPLVSAVPLEVAGKFLERVPSSLLWVRTESGEAAGRLRRFRPAPDVVLREGDTVRYVAFWALEEPLTREPLERANKRLAHALDCPKKHAGDGFRFYLPGTVLRVGRGRSLPVRMVKFRPAVHTAAQVVGRLRDAPNPDAWRERVQK